MLTVWRNVEVGRSVVVELTRIWLCWYVVEMFASNIRCARHTTAHDSRSIWHSFIHLGTQCWRIHCTQSCSIGRSCLQFHSLPMSFNSRQRHCHQPRKYRQKIYWRHRLALRQRQRPQYWFRRFLVHAIFSLRDLCARWANEVARVWELLLEFVATADNNVGCMRPSGCYWTKVKIDHRAQQCSLFRGFPYISWRRQRTYKRNDIFLLKVYLCAAADAPNFTGICAWLCGSAESQPNFYTLLASRIFIGANMAQTKMIAIKL